MNRLLSIVVFCLVWSIADQVGASSSPRARPPQLKYTRTQIWYLNPKYSYKFSLVIYRHNSTYNKLHIEWELSKDLPADVYASISVYVSNAEHKDAKLLSTNNIPLCSNTPDRYLLPKILQLPESQLNGDVCFKKGLYVTDDAGLFRVDLLVPNINEISDYYYTDYVILTKDEIISSLSLYSESGYLNTCQCRD